MQLVAGSLIDGIQIIIYDVFRNLWISFWNIPQALWSTKMGLDSGCAFLLQGIVLKSEWNCAEWLLLIFLMVEHRPEGPALNNVLWNICFGVLRIKKHCQWVLEQLPLLNQVFSLRPSRWLKPSWSEARVVFFWPGSEKCNSQSTRCHEIPVLTYLKAPWNVSLVWLNFLAPG